MWRPIDILIGRHVFMALSYAWAWMLAAELSGQVVPDAAPRLTWADVRALVLLMAVWTRTWAVMIAGA
jgi:hypothetical protein